MSARLKRSQRQERRGAEEFGGRVTPGSGNGWSTKNDVRTDDLSIEYKYTDKKSYTLKLDDLLRGERQALMDGDRDFVLIVELGGREWAVTPKDYLYHLYEFAAENL